MAPLPRGWLKAEWLVNACQVRDEDGVVVGYQDKVVSDPALFAWLRKNYFEGLSFTQYRTAVKRILEPPGPGYSDRRAQAIDAELREQLLLKIKLLGKKSWLHAAGYACETTATRSPSPGRRCRPASAAKPLFDAEPLSAGTVAQAETSAVRAQVALPSPRECTIVERGGTMQRAASDGLANSGAGEGADADCRFDPMLFAVLDDESALFTDLQGNEDASSRDDVSSCTLASLDIRGSSPEETSSTHRGASTRAEWPPSKTVSQKRKRWLSGADDELSSQRAKAQLRANPALGDSGAPGAWRVEDEAAQSARRPGAAASTWRDQSRWDERRCLDSSKSQEVAPATSIGGWGLIDAFKSFWVKVLPAFVVTMALQGKLAWDAVHTAFDNFCLTMPTAMPAPEIHVSPQDIRKTFLSYEQYLRSKCSAPDNLILIATKGRHDFLFCNDTFVRVMGADRSRHVWSMFNQSVILSFLHAIVYRALGWSRCGPCTFHGPANGCGFLEYENLTLCSAPFVRPPRPNVVMHAFIKFDLATNCFLIWGVPANETCDCYHLVGDETLGRAVARAQTA